MTNAAANGLALSWASFKPSNEPSIPFANKSNKVEENNAVKDVKTLSIVGSHKSGKWTVLNNSGVEGYPAL